MNLEAETAQRAQSDVLTGLIPGSHSAIFLIQPGPICLEMVLPIVSWALLYPISD